jgi:hypothetical protein
VEVVEKGTYTCRALPNQKFEVEDHYPLICWSDEPITVKKRKPPPTEKRHEPAKRIQKIQLEQEEYGMWEEEETQTRGYYRQQPMHSAYPQVNHTLQRNDIHFYV